MNLVDRLYKLRIKEVQGQTAVACRRLEASSLKLLYYIVQIVLDLITLKPI